jgi:hypothetical protein
MIMALLMVPACLAAQGEQTLMSGPIESGGFGGPVLKFTELVDEFGLLVGGRGGWIINHTFVLGAGGYGLANRDNFEFLVDGRARQLEMGYGGLELEYVNRSHELIHFSVQALVGAGGADWGRDFDFDPDFDDGDAFFVAEPGLNIIMNVTEFFRVGFGGSYRFVEDLELPGLSDDDLTGPSGVLTFKFGKF